jgi:hypothetical protein
MRAVGFERLRFKQTVKFRVRAVARLRVRRRDRKCDSAYAVRSHPRINNAKKEELDGS